jgi:hypothetical protein
MAPMTMPTELPTRNSVRLCAARVSSRPNIAMVAGTEKDCSPTSAVDSRAK